jgi:Kef-type K+ transport system membrane component KefB
VHGDTIIFSMFLIFAGAAVMATLALYARQAMLVGYIVLGAALGPWGLQWVSDTNLIQDIAQIGIIFLLFLLGLNLYPQKLVQLLRETTLVTLATTFLFGIIGWGIALLFGYSSGDSLLIGVAATFSSTIIGLKLLPTTVLHHRRMGEVIISVLLLQDVIAIIVLLVLQGLARGGGVPVLDVLIALLALPVLAVSAYVVEKYALLKLIRMFDRIQEYVFLLAIAWCLSIAQAAHWLGLSYEIGAFVAGVAVATNPISRHIAEHLKPLRDFFLVMFFFALGASLDVGMLGDVIVPAALLALVLLFIKPLVFRYFLMHTAESEDLAWETGWRLGQMSEFALLIAFLALDLGLASPNAVYLIEMATIMTFVGSTYLIVLRYPTPIAVSDKLRRD